MPTIETRRFLVLSTAHLTKQTRIWLGETIAARDGSGAGETHRWLDCGAHCVLGYPHEHGWFIYAHDLEDVEQIEPGITVPNDLRDCIRFARDHCCEWLMFDADAVTYEEHGLLVYLDRRRLRPP